MKFYAFGLIDMDILGPIICFGFAAFIFYTLLHTLYHMYFFSVPHPPDVEDLPFDGLDMLPRMQELHETLVSLGLIPLGLNNAKYAIMPKPIPEWMYTNDECTIWAEATQIAPEAPAMAQFHTVFEDDAMIITRFPEGEVSSTPTFHTRFAAKSLPMAYHYHLKKVESWQNTHGSPRMIMTVDDVKAYNEIYRAKHRAMDLEPLVWVRGVQAVMFAIAAILMFYNGLKFNDKDSFGAWRMIIFFMGSLTLNLMAFYIPNWLHKFRTRNVVALDQRKPKPKASMFD